MEKLQKSLECINRAKTYLEISYFGFPYFQFILEMIEKAKQNIIDHTNEHQGALNEASIVSDCLVACGFAVRGKLIKHENAIVQDIINLKKRYDELEKKQDKLYEKYFDLM